MFKSIENKVAQAGRRAALGLCASLFIIVGLAFATTALWIILAATLSTLHAAGIIGLVYSGIGLILLGVMLSAPRESRSAPQQPIAEERPNPDLPPLVQAFLFGLSAGSDASKSRKS